METSRTSSRVLCLILALLITIVGLRCDDMKNGNASSHDHNNATFVTFPNQGINAELKGEHDSSYDSNDKVHVENSLYYGGGGGGG
ncbi:hypothetical protein VIGAN_02030700, partial [Vigna angularis var. angularis]